jgi:hypothetical protein
MYAILGLHSSRLGSMHTSISTQFGVVPDSVLVESQTLWIRLMIEEAPRVADTVCRQFASSWSERKIGTQTGSSKHCLCQLGRSPTVRQRRSPESRVALSIKTENTYTSKPLFHRKRRGICSLFAGAFFTDSPATHSWRSYRPNGPLSENSASDCRDV